MSFEYNKAFTHGGVFHADDVFSAAFLKLLNPEIIIERGYKVPENYAGIVFDIGFGQYDHHQENNECRDNGVPYASLGKIWKAFAAELCSDYVINAVERELIEPIDAADNGIKENLLSTAIAALNPAWDSDEDSDSCFFSAVELAKEILSKMIRGFQSEERAFHIVEEAVKKAKNGIVILPVYCPWKNYVEDIPEIKFIIYPSQRGGYNIQTVPDKNNPFSGRVLFPEEWLGNPNEALGMTFCHPGNFLACTKTLPQAITVAEIAIRKQES